jgi:DNA repair photolyase
MINTALPHLMLSREVACGPDKDSKYVMNPYDGGCDYSCNFCPHGIRGALPQINSTELKRELKIWCRENINGPKLYIGTHSECLGPSEELYRLTLITLMVLQKHRHPYNLITKSAWIAMPPYLKTLHSDISEVQISILTSDDVRAATMESGCWLPSTRLDAMKTLVDYGIRTIARIEPIIPGYTNFDIFQDIADTGVKEVWFGIIRSMDRHPEVMKNVNKTYPFKLDSLLIKDGYDVISDICKDLGLESHIIDPTYIGNDKNDR